MENLLYRAVLILAGRCDGATKRDGAGYNKIDTSFGHFLADKPFDDWSAKHQRSAWRMLSKYREQLAKNGIAYEDIIEPQPVTANAAKSMWIKDNLIHIAYPYSRSQEFQRLLGIVRSLPNRFWNGTTWQMPARPMNAAAALDFGRREDFEVSDELRKLAQEYQPVDSPTSAPRDFVFSDEPEQKCLIKVTQDGIEISFPYDPSLYNLVMQLPRRRYSKKTRTWTIPKRLDALVGLQRILLARPGFTGDIDRVNKLTEEFQVIASASIEASKAASASLKIEGLGGTLRAFQVAGVAYALEKERCFIADEQGLGKTMEGLATVHAANAYPCLVICIASVKLNWLNECRKWLPGKRFHVIGGAESFGRPDADVTIVNFNRIRDRSESLILRKFKSLIIDESQNVKGPKTQQTIAAEQIALGVIYGRDENGKLDRRKKTVLGEPIPIRLLLSGTPLMNRPNELPPQLRILERLDDLGGWDYFHRRYCGMYATDYGIDTSGHSHLIELNEQLRATCFLRRLKKDVLAELPPKVRSMISVELSNRQEYDRAEADLIRWLKETKGQEKADAAQRAEQLVRISALKQLAARGKMKAATEWIADFLESDEKIVVAAWHREILDLLVSEFHCQKIDGEVPIVRRQAAVDAFQNDKKIKTIALQLKVIGITLTAASNVACLELGWNPATMDQIEDRLHRIGQTDSVNAWWFIARGTIDEDIAELIEEKRKVIDAVADGIEPTEDVSIMNELVNRLTKEGRTNEDRGSGKRPAAAADPIKNLALFS